MDLSWIIKRPIMTEKSMRLAADKWYSFEVSKKASKKKIAQAVQDIFGVEVIEVRTAKMVGKKRRFGKYRREIKLGDWKKAMVKIKPDQKIDIFEIKEKNEH